MDETETGRVQSWPALARADKWNAPGESEADARGEQRAPGESEADARGEQRAPGESEADARGEQRAPGESETDARGEQRGHPQPREGKILYDYSSDWHEFCSLEYLYNRRDLHKVVFSISVIAWFQTSNSLLN